MKPKNLKTKKKRKSVPSAMGKLNNPAWQKIQLPTIDSRISFVLTFNGALMGSEGYIIVNHSLDNNGFLLILLIPTMISSVLCVLGNMPGDFLLKYLRKYIAETSEELKKPPKTDGFEKKIEDVIKIKSWFLRLASICTILTILIIFFGLLDILYLHLLFDP
ncbi:MAG TPA: hypothetical protein ACFYEE_09190 [Candidatus Wujingus californicus]|uniref:hypothetical protein n=1 Tax=Candidatus Wujingus californicus TaxID=3367618 RepID=UPI002714201A|nr:hypothetical protein [Candidatus Brocadiales bacterium]